MKALDNFLEAQQEVWDYFGYVEDWVAIPIDDRRKNYWTIIKGNKTTDIELSYPDSVVYSRKPLTAEVVSDGGEYYMDSIYYQRFLPKHIYEGEDFTMICVDTHTDGNKFLAIYSNDKKQELDFDFEEAHAKMIFRIKRDYQRKALLGEEG